MTSPDPATPDQDDAATPGDAGDSGGTPTTPGGPASSDKLVLCPYCGATQRGGDRCQACGGLFELLSQKATQIGMGPWYIRDKANPFRPGCSYEVLTKMIAGGRIKPTTVIRGPSTKQFWSIARNVEGVSHLLGYCHNCGAHVDPDDKTCEVCQAKFKPIDTRNELGLRFRTQAEADQARRELDSQVAGEAPPAAPKPAGPRQRASLHASDAATLTKRRGMLEDVLDDEAGDEADTPGAEPSTTTAAPSRRRAASLSAFETESHRTIATRDDDDDDAPDQGTTVNPAVWVLITLNIVAVVGVVLLYLWFNRG